MLLRSLMIAGLAGGALTGLSVAVWALCIEPASLRLVTHRITIPALPAELRGLRIAVISDLHAGALHIDGAKIDLIVEQTNAAAPDLVFLAGDFGVSRMIGGRRMPFPDIAARLAGLKAPLGVWAVLGNHDWYVGSEMVREALQGVGIPVLENRTVPLPGAPLPLWLVGIGDAFTNHDDTPAALAGLPEGGLALCLTHTPDVFPELPAACLLTVSGHTHGGQVVFPLVGALTVPSQYGSRYLGGDKVEDGRHLFVSTGIGTSALPVRFGVPPEISLLILQ